MAAYSQTILLVGTLSWIAMRAAQSNSTYASRCALASAAAHRSALNKSQCCDEPYNDFQREWARGDSRLTQLLADLRDRNCTQFRDECADRTFAFTEFAALVYDRFCSFHRLEAKCTDVLLRVAPGGGDQAVGWQELAARLGSAELSDDDLRLPCVQVAMHDNDDGFHEIVQPIVPFCEFVWCGFSKRVARDRKVSAWSCMPQRCKVNIAILMAAAMMLAIAVVVCNLTIIAILIAQRATRRVSQAVYRLSIAVADLIVGAVVLPSFVTTMYRYLILSHIPASATDSIAPTSEPADEGDGFLSGRFPPAYLNAIGLCTIVSLTVSVFTLVAAAVDRLVALSRPLRYDRRLAHKIAKSISCGLWILALMFATLPIYARDLRYTVVGAILVSSSGRLVLVLYIVAFLVPLLAMWIVTAATSVTSRKYDHAVLSSSSVGGDHHLWHTLALMVTAFTTSVSPSVVVLLFPLFRADIYFSRPRRLDPAVTGAYTSAEVVTSYLLMSNSLWNAFIYSVRDRDFRRATARIRDCRLFARLCCPAEVGDSSCADVSGGSGPDERRTTAETTQELNETVI